MATIYESLQLALQHHQAGRAAVAEQIYRQVLAVVPDQPDALHLLGVALTNRAQYDAAIEYIGRAIAQNPQQPVFHNNLGNAWKGRGNLTEAAACYRRALERNPDYAIALGNLGNTLRELGQLDEAVAYLQRTLQMQPRFFEAHNNLGNALRDLGRLDEAVASYRRALECKPDSAETLSNLGVALREQGDLESAKACYRRSLELSPARSDTYLNLGVALQIEGKLDEAIGCFEQALTISPDDPEAHKNMALSRLTRGEFARGWAEYEWRWKTRDLRHRSARRFGPTHWDGSSLAGKTICVYCEQGFGDVFQFVRYVRVLKEQGAVVVLEAQKALHRILALCPWIDRLATPDNPTADCDWTVPLLSLPGILGTTMETIPAEVPYLFADQRLVEQWRERLAGIPGFKIGIAWQGNRQYRDDRWRSIPLRAFAPLAAVSGVRLIDLQKGDDSAEIAAVAGQFEVLTLESLDEASGPFMDTAAVMRSLDLVIAPDTSIAHLAGGLGVSVWVALAWSADWRWFRNRDDSPWYPTARLFRQRSLGDWDDVFSRIAAAVGGP